MQYTTPFLSSLLIVSAACSAPPVRSTPAPAPIDITGAWQTSCAESPDHKSHFKMDFQITADRWKLAYGTYADVACQTKLVDVDVAGPYEIGDAVPGIAGAHLAVMHFDHKTITPIVQPLADALNGMPDCGGGYAPGVAHDVLAGGCPEFGQYPRAQCGADYDLVWRDGDQLRFGARPADNNLCSAEHRPTALSDMTITRRR